MLSLRSYFSCQCFNKLIMQHGLLAFFTLPCSLLECDLSYPVVKDGGACARMSHSDSDRYAVAWISRYSPIGSIPTSRRYRGRQDLEKNEATKLGAVMSQAPERLLPTEHYNGGCLHLPWFANAAVQGFDLISVAQCCLIPILRSIAINRPPGSGSCVMVELQIWQARISPTLWMSEGRDYPTGALMMENLFPLDLLDIFHNSFEHVKKHRRQ